MKSKKYIELEEKFIRIQNIYKVVMKKYFNLVEERKRHNILIEQQKEKIKELEKKVSDK